MLISGVRQQLEGAPFGMFAFAPVGAGIFLAGIAFLAFGWRLLPRRHAPPAADKAQFRIEDYTTEALIPPGSPMIGKTAAALEGAVALGDINLAAVIGGNGRRRIPQRDLILRAGDTLLIDSDPQTLKKLVDLAGLTLAGSKQVSRDRLDAEEIGSVEAIVPPDSELIGASPETLRMRRRYGVNLLALSRRGERLRTRLQHARFRAGDVVVLQGRLDDMPETLSRLRVLPLAARNIQLGRPRRMLRPVLILAAAVTATALALVPAAIAFVAAALAIAVFRVLSLRDVCQSVEWPILMLLGPLIPLGEAVRRSGVADLLADGLHDVPSPSPGIGVLALVTATTMLLTPLVHHAASVIIMGPIAASLAAKLGFHPDAFLMAIAIGANSDFLTPIGHQNNTLVLVPGGYRLGDYARLGLPLSLIVIVVGTGLIAAVWPLR